MTTILTTSGISLYLNTDKYLKATKKEDVKEPSEDQMRHYLRMEPHKASSEANSLLQMAAPGDSLVFFHTKDPRAVVSAKLLKEYFENEGYKAPRLVELDFQSDAKQIETLGIRSLVDALIREIRTAQRKSEDIIINATAGLKAQVVYSTMIGMLYQIPVKYIYEEFRNLMTFNPIALEWDTSIFLSYSWFFQWLDGESIVRQWVEVEQRLKAIPDRERIEVLLEKSDETKEVYLSPMGDVLWSLFRHEESEAHVVEWPPDSQIEDTPSKINNSMLKQTHHTVKRGNITILDFCLEIAKIDCVQAITSGFFENTTYGRIKRADPNGAITVLWAGDNFAQNLVVQTTAQGKIQTLKVADKIRELLEKYQ